VIRTRVSFVAGASPERISSAITSTVKPRASIIASVQPSRQEAKSSKRAPGGRAEDCGADGKAGKRGIGEREHAPQFLARARRVRTMGGGVAILVEASQAWQLDRWRRAHLLIARHLPRDAGQRGAPTRGT